MKGGAVGRLEVPGKTVFDAYWNNPALTHEAIHDGWFFTGDVARFSPAVTSSSWNEKSTDPFGGRGHLQPSHRGDRSEAPRRYDACV